MRKGLFIILLVLLTMSGAALAQEMPPVLCGDLSEADCAILEQSQAAMKELTAASTSFNVDVQVQAEGMTIPVNVSGSAAFSGVTPMEHDMEAMDLENLDFAAMLEAMRAFSGELIINVTVPPEMAAGEGLPNTVALELRLVEGVGYINFDPLQPIIGDPSFEGWGGLDIASLIGSLLEEITPEMLAEMGAQMGAEMGNIEMFGADPEMMMQFSDPEFIGQYMFIVRTDDGSGTLATFETSIDFAGFFSDPAFQEMMREQIEAQVEMQGEELSEADMEMALGMVSVMFDNLDMVVIESIDTATNLVQNISFTMDMDLSEMMAMSGESSEPFVVEVDVTVDYSYDVPEIVAPADANVLPYEQLLMMLGGMMGEMGDMGGMMPMVEPTPGT